MGLTEKIPMLNKDKPDDLQRQINAQEKMSTLGVAANTTGVEEQMVLENQKERAELTKWQQDMADDVELMVHRLRQEVVNNKNEWERPDGTEPLCSDECIQRIVAMIEPSTSKNLMMSKYEKDNILLILLGLSNTLAIDVLLPNRRRFKIRMSDMSLIMRVFQTAVGPTYFRALGANEKQYLGSIRSDKYFHMEGMQPAKKKSMLGF